MHPIAAVLDVRPLPPPKRHEAIFQTFAALLPGTSFVLVNDHEPKPLLYQLQAEHAGRFEWNVLQKGPELFRVEIVRRERPGSRGIAEFLGADHKRLDALAIEAERLVGAADRAGATARFAEFACGLNRHIDIEEFLLFPLFVQVTGMERGPVDVMRDEHVRIRHHLEEARAAIAAGDDARFTGAVRSMKAVLGEHNMKEEEILYPMTDEGLGDGRERDDFVKRMQAY